MVPAVLSPTAHEQDCSRRELQGSAIVQILVLEHETACGAKADRRDNGVSSKLRFRVAVPRHTAAVTIQVQRYAVELRRSQLVYNPLDLQQHLGPGQGI